MRLAIREDGAIEISALREIEHHFLRRIAAAADPAGCEAARRRIFPESAVRAGDPGADEASARDWRELVVADLEHRFKRDLDVVGEDLERVEPELGDGEGRAFRLIVPARNAEAWFSALNQARLVLAQRHDLPLSAEELEGRRESFDERWLAFVQSNLYAFLQSFLLETVLRIPE